MTYGRLVNQRSRYRIDKHCVWVCKCLVLYSILFTFSRWYQVSKGTWFTFSLVSSLSFSCDTYQLLLMVILFSWCSLLLLAQSERGSYTRIYVHTRKLWCKSLIFIFATNSFSRWYKQTHTHTCKRDKCKMREMW